MTNTRSAQEPCPPVIGVFGKPPDFTLEGLAAPGDLLEEIEQVAGSIEDGYGHYQSRLIESGEAARRALDLGCTACSAAVDCEVRESLEKRMAFGQERVRNAAMNAEIAEAPLWLQVARE